MLVDGVEYDEIPKSAVLASKYLTDVWVKLGSPTDPFTDSGAKVVDVIIAIWQDLYPLDAETWYAERTEYKNAELSITSQVYNKTGRSLASYPFPIYQMMRKVFKGFDPAERKNCMSMVKKWPMFQFANKV